MHRLQELVRLHRAGHRATDIARTIGLDPKTERKYRRRIQQAGLLEGDVDDVPGLAELRRVAITAPATPAQELSSVAEYASYIEKKRAKGLGPTAIHALLREEKPGFDGSLSAVKRLFKRLQKRGGPRAEDVAIPVHTQPGRQAQVDFGYVGKLLDPATDKRRKAWVFVMVLSHSRKMFARVVFDQSVETWVDLHKRAFRFFGGVPRVVVPDNLKAAVIRAAFKSDEVGEINRSYRELARHHGFMIDPTPAYSPEKKGKVESAVKYVKGAFFEPRAESLLELDDVNRRLDAWVRETANLRVHGTTHRQPEEVFEADEAEALLGLPDTAYVPVLWHQARVGGNCHVTFQGRFYSVPWQHIDKEAWLKVRGQALTVYVDDERVADHRTDGSTPWSTEQNHLPEGRRDLALRDPDTWYARAAAIAAEVESYARAVMASDEVLYPLRRVQSIVCTLEGLTTERAVSVVQHAARYGCYRPDAIRKIVSEGLDLEPSSIEWVSPTWATAPRFARESGDWLKNLGDGHGDA